jgi:hypothetical protein
LTTGTASDVSGAAGGVSWVLVAPTVMPELVNVAGAACSWVIAKVMAPTATTALPPITAASIFTLFRLIACTLFAPLWVSAGSEL